MRNKIKQIMNKEEGFTLVELLAVIVILGIIVAIAIPAVGSIIDRAGTDASAAEDSLVIDAARLYFTTEKTEENSVNVDELVSKGYLDQRSGESLTGDVSREPVTGGGYDYSYTR